MPRQRRHQENARLRLIDILLEMEQSSERGDVSDLLAHLDIAVADHYGVEIHGPHTEDAFWIEQLPAQSKRFGFGNAQVFTPDRWLQEGDSVQFGDETMEVYHCPGHTPGHVIFFSRANRLALVGDVLFAGSIGRTDFPRGNHSDLVRSVQEKLWPLGDDVTFVPGHGPASTFGHERRTNPFVGDRMSA